MKNRKIIFLLTAGLLTITSLAVIAVGIILNFITQPVQQQGIVSIQNGQADTVWIPYAENTEITYTDVENTRSNDITGAGNPLKLPQKESDDLKNKYDQANSQYELSEIRIDWDSISYYMSDEWLSQQEEIERETGIAEILTESEQPDMEIANADSLNADNLFECAYYLYNIREYSKAEIYYQECLEIFKALANENPETYLSDVAATLNNLANIHSDIYEYFKALDEYEEALDIRRKLAGENPEVYLSDVAQTLNNLSILHSNMNEYSKALENYEEVLDIRRKLAGENTENDSSDAAQALNNLAFLHSIISEYPTPADEYEEVFLAHARLSQNRFSETEETHNEWSQTTIDNNETSSQTLLDNTDGLGNANDIPETSNDQVEKTGGISGP